MNRDCCGWRFVFLRLHSIFVFCIKKVSNFMHYYFVRTTSKQNMCWMWTVFINNFKMATVFDSPFIRQRLHRLRRRDYDFDEDQRFGRCDCTSYSYFVLSMVLFSVGTVITVLALGDADGYILSNLGHMWLVGPIFICSGMMVAVKSMLYLRRKSVIQMLLHQRAIIRVCIIWIDSIC